MPDPLRRLWVPCPCSSVFCKGGAFDFPSFAPNFQFDLYYPRGTISLLHTAPRPSRGVSIFGAMFVPPASCRRSFSLLAQASACARFHSANPKLNSKETFMSSLSAKDRVSLCSFTFSDGRRCRTPRTCNNPRFCPYHAQKEARARAAQKLGKDLDYFFSGDYLSACDLSTALARLIPAVVRGDVKPKTAHTVAYMAQTLLQAIHISEQEYTNTSGTDGWRKSIRNSVNGNRDYRFPPAPQQLAAQAPDAVAGPQTGAGHAPQPAPPTQPAPQPAQSPHTPLPPTGAEFVQQVAARLHTGDFQASSEHRIHSACGGRSEPATSPPQPQIQAQQTPSAPPSSPPPTAPLAHPLTVTTLRPTSLPP